MKILFGFTKGLLSATGPYWVYYLFSVYEPKSDLVEFLGIAITALTFFVTYGYTDKYLHWFLRDDDTKIIAARSGFVAMVVLVIIAVQSVLF
jgi:hypothetical protein